MDDNKLDWGAKLVARQVEFKNSKYILEIGAGDFSRTVSLATLFPNKIFFGIDFEYSLSAQKTVSNNSNLDNINFIKFNAIKKLFADNLFDFSFSIAVGEHIAELGGFLQEISRILRPGGAYYFVQSPFWTSYKGHHYRHGEPEVVQSLGGYLHLIYTPAELKNHLQSIGWLEEASSSAVARIFE